MTSSSSLDPAVTRLQDWSLQPVSVQTRWAASVSPDNAWPEYPRPQMVRAMWQNLNGLWQYVLTAKSASAPAKYDAHILVPYPIESALSGVQKALQPDQALWYRRIVHLAPVAADERVLLHFGAVDYEATVYLNDKEVGSHCGGYQSFTFDVSGAIRPGSNELVVRVYDPTEFGSNAHGKQRLRGRWMFYSASSGIWQTVWIERVPSTYIAGLKLTPDVDRRELCIEVRVGGERDGCSIEAIAHSGEIMQAQQAGRSPMALRLEEPRLWSPDDPYLYDLHVRLLQDGVVVDVVKSYFAMRKIEVKQDAQGRGRIQLNNRYTYNLGVVDQGFWPDGLYTAPSDAALIFDVEAIKALGFNTVRKHLKIESERWYYHCDRLGLMVWQDMPSGSNDTQQARRQFEQEIEQNVAQLHNHPSVTMWVLFNEGWGAYDQERLANSLAQADRSRLINGHSGPYDQLHDSHWLKRRDASLLLEPVGGPGLTVEDLQRTQYRAPANWMAGDIADIHIYPGPEMFPAQADVASVTGEHGSFGVYIADHVWDELGPVGRGVGASGLTPQEMLTAYARSIARLRDLEAQGLSGSLYFQIVDVEKEHQGLLTYDRAIAKVPIAEIARLNAMLVERANIDTTAIGRLCVEPADCAPAAQRYTGLVEEFRDGRRDLPFLRRLALTALRQGDAAQATEASSEFICRAPHPFDKGTWASIVAMTHGSHDTGFELLRTRLEEVNAVLAPQTAEKKIQQIVGRELIAPYFRSEPRKLSWTEFENAVADHHGVLGREAVVGARMMDSLLKADWAEFGTCYVRYFATAIARSTYSLHSLSHRVLRYVEDEQALEAAAQVMSWQITAEREYPVFGRYDPTELDTYANLLYRLGRNHEALEWQALAVTISNGRDPEIVAGLHRMQRGHGVGNNAVAGTVLNAAEG